MLYVRRKNGKSLNWSLRRTSPVTPEPNQHNDYLYLKPEKKQHNDYLRPEPNQHND